MNKTIICGRIHEIRKREKCTYITIMAYTQNRNEFIDVTLFNRQSEFFNKYFQTGQWISIDGHLHNNTYNGITQLTVIADNINFCGDKSQPTQSSQSPQSNDWDDIPQTGDIPFC